MVNALNAAATGMEAQMTQIEHISNNLANVNTNGYKKSRAEFQDLLYETLQEPGANTAANTTTPVGIQRGMGVQVSGTQRNFEMGTPQHTSRDLDMFIKGDGFFAVQLPTGETGYRRDGSFYRGASGKIETIDGYPLLPEISVPQNAKRVQISDDGIVNAFFSDTEKSQIGQIQLASFVNNGGLKAAGKNLFTATDASGPANFSNPHTGATGGILQQYVEGSNVEIVKEMTDMIAAQRAFEMNAKVVQAVDSVLQHTVNVR
jgi:flagellar basal-body rod protein FlgG